MALSRVKSWIANEVLTASDLNAEFNNILNNALSLISPLTGNLNANLKSITNLLFETQASSQTAATEGRVYYQTTEDQVHVDDGSAIRRVPTIASVTRGSIIRGSSTANVFSQLAIGSANTVLTSDGTDPAWSGTPTIATEDSRTNTTTRPVTITATTSGTPAASIGVGTLWRAESGDENPSDFGALDFVATDVTAASEDTVADIHLRTAGAALGARYRLAATGANRVTITHAASADRTITLPNTDLTLAAPNGDRVVRTAGDITTTSTSLVDLTAATITLTTGANRCLVGFAADVSNSSAGEGAIFNVIVDSTLLLGTAGIKFANPTANLQTNASFTVMTDTLTAASHTIKIQWMVTAGTGTVRANGTNNYLFWVQELN